MTNSYSLSPSPRIVFIHGLNNNSGCFLPLMAEFERLGFETVLVTLPRHGARREEAKDFKEALTAFDLSMRALGDAPYYAVAFSHGALYLQLWLEKNSAKKPLKQILLAPAFFIRRHELILKIVRTLPSFLPIKSISPKQFQRYGFLKVRDYEILLAGITVYQKLKKSFKVPSLVILDPEDEVVEASLVKSEVERNNPGLEVKYVERRALSRGLGRHHILFHPSYFERRAWEELIQEMKSFLD